MSTKIGLIGDPHATPEPLAESLDIFRQERVDEIWCTGDIAGYGTQLDKTVKLLENGSCRVIHGNHDLWHLEKSTPQDVSLTNEYLKYLPSVLQEKIKDKRLYMVHASPPQSTIKGMRLLDENGRVMEEEKQSWTEQLANFASDVLIIGHTHQVFANQLGNTLVINPGSTRFNHCCAVLSLPSLSIQWFPLSGQSIKYTWNWREEYNDHQ